MRPRRTTANARVNAGAGAAAAATPATTSTGMQSNVAALLTYILGIMTAVIFLVIDPYKNDRFVRFHAFQSLFFGLAWMILWVAWIFLWGMLAFASGGALFWIGIPLRMLVGLAGPYFGCSSCTKPTTMRCTRFRSSEIWQPNKRARRQLSRRMPRFCTACGSPVAETAGVCTH